MRAQSNNRLWWLLTLPALAYAITVGCNKNTDDPHDSASIVTVSGIDPLTACIDNDGTLIDTNNDGTGDTTVYQAVVQTVQFESRLKGSASGTFNDVILTDVEIDYVINGFPPANRKEGITVTVPAGGTAAVGLTTVLARDVPQFGSNDTGYINLIFRGKDIGGAPVKATGRIPIEVVQVCSGS